VSGFYRRRINSNTIDTYEPWSRLDSSVLDRSREADSEDDDGPIVTEVVDSDQGIPCKGYRITYPAHMRAPDTFGYHMRQHLIRYIDKLNRLNTEEMDKRRKSLCY
jgi:hypothetical protein